MPFRKPGEADIDAEHLFWTFQQFDVGHTYDFPFRILDHKEDMRVAYICFASELS